MNLYCPSCQSAFPGTDVCPRCGVRLLTPAEAFTLMPEREMEAPDTIRATLLTRLVVGLTVGSGLYLGLHEWATATGTPSEGSPENEAGAWVGFGMQVLAVIVGGLLAGAGRPLGLFTGLIVGAGIAAMSVVPAIRGEGIDGLGGGLAFGIVAIGAVAGFIGAKVWPATSEVVDPIGKGSGSSLAHLAHSEDRAKTFRQTDWLRIVVAVTIALIGLGGSGSIRSGIRSTTNGMIHMGGPGTSPMTDFWVMSLFVLVASVLAGSNTRSGPRHGLILGAAIGLIAIAMSTQRIPSAIVGLLKLFDIHPDISNPNAMLAVMATFLTVCGVTGWFGGQLLPPLAPKWMLKKRLVD